MEVRDLEESDEEEYPSPSWKVTKGWKKTELNDEQLALAGFTVLAGSGYWIGPKDDLGRHAMTWVCYDNFHSRCGGDLSGSYGPKCRCVCHALTSDE